MKMLHALLVNCYRFCISLLLAIGLTCVSGYAQSSRLFSTADALPNTLINDVIEDANSMIWVATEYGLCKYDGSKFTTYQYEVGNPHSLQNNYVRTLFVDVKGHLLIGSRCGLQVYRPETDDFSEVARFVDCQLESNDVTHIIERKNGESYLTDDHIRLLAKTYHDFEPVEGLAAVVTNEAIQGQKNSLAVNRYVRCVKGDSLELDLPGMCSAWRDAARMTEEAVSAFTKLV